MATEIRELEGTWEEIMEHAEELAGMRVRLVVLPERDKNFSTAASLLKYAGTWQGDDLEECLRLVYETRGRF